MNRRQKKKHEKKRLWQQELTKIQQVMNDVLERMGKMAESIAEVAQAARRVDEAFARWAKTMEETVGKQAEADRILKRAYPLPKGTDKSLLKHHGILEDSGGWIYDVYYDEANGEYFAELLEGGDDGHGKEEGDHA